MNQGAVCAVAGMAGATMLTAVHQTARQYANNAPRMDEVGMRGLARLREAAGAAPIDQDRLYEETFVGDLIANSLYYSLVGIGPRRGVFTRGMVLGLLAGAGALFLPRHMGLGDPPHSDRRANQLMTVGLYVIGGLAAAYTARELSDTQPLAGSARRARAL